MGRPEHRASEAAQDHSSGAEETILLDCLESDLQEHADEERVLCFGRTAKGRLLTVIYSMRGEAVRVVTGYPMTKPQQRLYFQGK